MKRALMVGMSVATAAAVSLPALVVAQDFPPPPPSTYYGTVTGGATVGQGVIAVVSSGGGVSQTCGDGRVLLDGGTTVYVVDVIQNAQKAGCGAAGRTIQFYFTPIGGNPGRLSVESATWSDPGAPKQQNLTLGASLTTKGYVPMVSRDGVN